ncbi:MAG: NADH-quinone oxidoreductase subunit A [Planctomycetes bacterium]|nr:NADH-quinone oxidoreductase subunit A [Planctomycetota bacterium]
MSPLAQYFPIAVLVLFAIVVAVFLIGLDHFLGPRQPNPTKLEPYECGILGVGTARQRFKVGFYIVALLFLLFDVETVFLYTWVVLFMPLGLIGFVEVALFLFVLAVGLYYAWRKGALEWE